MKKKLAPSQNPRNRVEADPRAQAWLAAHAKELPPAELRGGLREPLAECAARQQRDREREPYRADARKVKRAKAKRTGDGGIELALPSGWERPDPPRPPPPPGKEWPAASYRVMARVVASYADQAFAAASGDTVDPADFGDLRAMFAALMGPDRLPENEWRPYLRGALAYALMARLGDPRRWTRESGVSGQQILDSLKAKVAYVPSVLTARLIDDALSRASPAPRGGRTKVNWLKAVEDLIERVANHKPTTRR